MTAVLFALALTYYPPGNAHNWLWTKHTAGSYADCLANAEEILRHDQRNLLEVSCIPIPGWGPIERRPENG